MDFLLGEKSGFSSIVKLSISPFGHPLKSLIFVKSLINRASVKTPHAVPNRNAALSSSPRENNAFMIGHENVHAPIHAQMLYRNMAPLLPPVLGWLISPFSFSTATMEI